MRSAEFDRAHVLQQAMQTFMEHGYSKASMQKLTQATGLHPGSIYCAFGSKKGLFIEAVSHYHQQKQQAFDTIFIAQRPVVDSLREFIANTVTECVQKTCAKVCLLTRSLNEIEGQDPEVANILAQNLKQLEQNLAAQIRRAQHQGEAVNQDDAMKLARFLAMGIYGMRTYAFTQPDEALLTQMGEQLLAAIIVD
ncbi:TetR/AcrR family transcriptional regulator [Pseudoalteromonas sp. CnMc7-15]|uniref:TetR/AcrR family transcriptional regulator n=1 Tax=unclassified Pseudoalteromonas TaxID=194690 RepID=UPI001EF4B710|nr:TetR/AcrR family transcriptional regulator [Pseudoalteromonas sp. CnMc7-15]MCG7564768.1 TetR/AcrR family transcriptional regulator [Pseudoalteromonas sp. CnMc7-15]